MVRYALAAIGNFAASAAHKPNMPSWLSDPTTIPALKAADFWFGAIGLGITLITFGFGWWKLTKVQAAAEAAREAVSEVKLRVSRYDATIDVSEALYSYQEMTRQFDDACDWRIIVRSMGNVRRTIIRMEKSVSSIDPGLAAELKRTSTKLAKHITVIERAVDGHETYPAPYMIREAIRLGEETFEKARSALEEAVK